MQLITTGVVSGTDTVLTPLTGLVNGDSLLTILGCQLDNTAPVPTVPGDFVAALGPYQGVEDNRQVVRIYDGVVSGSPSSYTITGLGFNHGQPAGIFELEGAEAIGDAAANLTAVTIDTTIDSPSVTPTGSADLHVIWVQTASADEGASIAPPAGYSIIANIPDTSATRPQRLVIATKTLSSSSATGAQTWTGLVGTDAKIAGSFIVETGSAAPIVSGNPTIDSAGTSLSITFNESVDIGAGGNGGFVLSTGQSLVYASGDGTATLVYTISPAVKQGLTPTLAYTQPGDGVEATDDGADVATFSGQAITNSSTAVPTITVDLGIGTGGSVTSLTNLRLDVLSGGAAPRTVLYSVDNETSDGSTDVVVTDDDLGNIGDTVYVAIVDTDSTPDRTVFIPVTLT